MSNKHAASFTASHNFKLIENILDRKAGQIELNSVLVLYVAHKAAVVAVGTVITIINNTIIKS